MKHFNSKKIFAAVFAAVFCVNAFARWGAPDPMFPYEVIKAFDYKQSNWMSKLPANTPLNKVAMVSSHDAGLNEDVYPYPTCGFSTQYHTIYEQLSFGVRFFDLRVKFSKGAFWTCHQATKGIVAYGMSMANIFDDAVKFLKEKDSKDETIIFELSHWQSKEEMKSALNVILNNPEWSGKLFKDESNSEQPPILNEVTLNQVRGKIIIIVAAMNPSSEEPVNALDHELAKEGFTPAKGIWRFGAIADGDPSKSKYGYFRLYDSYSDAKSYDYMRDDQARKFNSFVNDYNQKTDSFLYCWQLTAKGEPINLYARKCNPHLDTELNTVVHDTGHYPNLVNLDYIDNRICNVVINLNLALIDKDAVSYIEPRHDNTQIEDRKYVKQYTELKGEYNDVCRLTNGWYVIDGNVEMKKGAIAMGESVNILLKDNCTLKITGDGVPGIRADNIHNYLKIYAQSSNEATMGKMIVSASYHNAAIGGSEDKNGNNIYIFGGNIEAYGGEGAAAIGGGYAGSGETILIYGGIVRAKSFKDGAAIGGGTYNGGGADGRDINIYGGKVFADASDRSTTAAGIGGGWGGNGEDITIAGGYVEAKGTVHGAGIGGGACWKDHGGNGELIRIQGGEVHAEGGSAIGGGKDRDGKDIEISGGLVYATAITDSYAAAIGGGHGGSAHDIEVSGGHLIITGSKSGAGIGGGCKNGGGADATDISISGGTIEITNINNAYSIGAASGGTTRNLRITGGTICAHSGYGVAYATNANGVHVLEVPVPECGSDNTPVRLEGVPSYGNKDMLAKGDKAYIWLPSGSYTFSTERHMYLADVRDFYPYPSKVDVYVVSSSHDVVVGSAGYATLYSDKKLIVPENVQVYAYTIKTGTGELVPVAIGKDAILPANQGYVVRAKEGTYHFFESGSTPMAVESVLKGVLQDTPVSEFCPGQEKYGLANKDGKTAFYRYNGTTVKAGKAYLVK